jgi:SAM-dependent methyltransferase
MASRTVAKSSLPVAVHLEGGNYFDDMRINIAASHQLLDALPRNPGSKPHSRLGGALRRRSDEVLQHFDIQSFLVTSGLRSAWFRDFHSYWSDILQGRRLEVADFMMLLHDYRKRQQYIAELSWGSPAEHVENWQVPALLYSTMFYARRQAIEPVRSGSFWRYIRAGATILEYGCSLAPYYNSYRRYYSHRGCNWILADIPSFPFHYAKCLFWNDRSVQSFVTIEPQDFGDPLKGKPECEVIFLTTVLEHLDDPLFVAGYLLERLKSGGILIFDYILSEGLGLDTSAGLEKRKACLEFILEKTEVVVGKVEMEKTTPLTVVRKR